MRHAHEKGRRHWRAAAYPGKLSVSAMTIPSAPVPFTMTELVTVASPDLLFHYAEHANVARRLQSGDAK